jgi:hypothetical protein
MMKGLGERRKAPKANVAVHRFANLSDGLQGIEDLKTSLEMTLIISTEEKTCETIVTHVKADLEDTPQPLPGVPNVSGFRVVRT